MIHKDEIIAAHDSDAKYYAGTVSPSTKLSTDSCQLYDSFAFPLKFKVTHSSVLAWRIPGTGEPGWLPSMGSHKVGHN